MNTFLAVVAWDDRRRGWWATAVERGGRRARPWSAIASVEDGDRGLGL